MTSRVRTDPAREDGFSLMETLIALVIVTVVIIGAMTGAGALSSSVYTVRVARDYTVAGIYLTGLNEFIAGKGGSAARGEFCVGRDCRPVIDLPVDLAGYPLPPGDAGQLEWTRLDVAIETWIWDAQRGRYLRADDPARVSGEMLTRVRSSLTWQIRQTQRALSIERFL